MNEDEIADVISLCTIKIPEPLQILLHIVKYIYNVIAEDVS